MNLSLYVCLQCGSHLDLKGEVLMCSLCNATVPMNRGVPDFAPASPNRLAQTVSFLDAAERDWAAALSLRCRDEILGGAPLDDERATDWRFLAPSPLGRTLVADNGWGGAALALAPHVELVYVLSRSWERAAFTAIRGASSGFDNIAPFFASGRRLPLPDSSFDAVSLPPQAGVFLNEAARILRPNGVLHVRFENRLAPRMGASGAARSTLAGYRRRLLALGFDQLRVYAAVPPGTLSPLFHVPVDRGGAPFSQFLSWVLPFFETISPEVRDRFGPSYKIGTAIARMVSRLRVGGLFRGLAPELVVIAEKSLGHGGRR